ncbi:MAG: peptide-methionine (S)-S-oxide reductase MsrA [Candidatus Omnitrophota bacterium]
MREKAIFAAGCFWHVESAFRQVKGVVSVRAGYTGGYVENPSYEDVCSDETGHVEAVEIEYDPAVVSYQDLLFVFWKIHDPTTFNRQGPDVGSQYRSVIFYVNKTQEALAKASKEEQDKSGRYSRPIVTQIHAAVPFYQAEEYHQNYLAKKGLPSCKIK